MASRLGGLAPHTIAVIELLAIGEPLGMSELETITDPAGLEDAEAQGFVQVRQDGRRTQARLAHPVYGEALRQSLPRSRLRRISAVLAGAMTATGARRREDLLRLGRWQLDSGVPCEPALLSRAARRAGEMFDLELATRLAQAALDLGGGVDAGLVLGEARFRSGRHQEAESVLAGLMPLCETDSELARVASARAHNLHNLVGDPGAAAAILDAALASVTAAGPRLQLLGRFATMKVFESDPGGGLSAAAPLLDSDDDSIVSRGCFISSIALALLGKTQEAVSVAYAGMNRHRRAADVSQLPEAQLIGAVLGHSAGGNFAQAEMDAATGHQACLAAGDKEGQASFLFLTGCVLIERGHLARASRAFLDGTSVNREIRDLAALRWCLAGLALAEAMSGHSDLAVTAASERDELPANPMTIYETDLVDRSRAWVSVATGELSRACETLTDAAARAASGQLRIAEARLLHDLARLGQPSAAARRAGELAAACGDIRTPGMSLAGDSDGLTRREREVASMAASGASSREIAARLVLSVRTVDNHLQNVYSKLGVTSRDELAAIRDQRPAEK